MIFSDLFDDPLRITEALHHFQFRYHEIVVFHLMAEEEITFPFRKFTDFKSLEISNEQLRGRSAGAPGPISGAGPFVHRYHREILRPDESGLRRGEYQKSTSQTLATYLSGRRESLSR